MILTLSDDLALADMKESDILKTQSADTRSASFIWKSNLKPIIVSPS
jgi:hypothetical protein